MKKHQQTLVLEKRELDNLPFALKLAFHCMNDAEEIKYKDGVIQVTIDKEKLINELKQKLKGEKNEKN